MSSAEAAERQIDLVRRRERAATHHCTAYRVGEDGATARSNDDGEPSGTAGVPILRQVDARELTNVLVVVTRYFGGTKLGTGGLVRSYGAVASEALDLAGIAEHEIRVRLRLSFSYDDTSPAMQVIKQYEARIEASAYSEMTELTVSVRRSAAPAFATALADAMGGRGGVERIP